MGHRKKYLKMSIIRIVICIFLLLMFFFFMNIKLLKWSTKFGSMPQFSDVTVRLCFV